MNYSWEERYWPPQLGPTAESRVNNSQMGERRMHKDKCQFTMWLWKIMGIQLCYTLLSTYNPQKYISCSHLPWACSIVEKKAQWSGWHFCQLEYIRMKTSKVRKSNTEGLKNYSCRKLHFWSKIANFLQFRLIWTTQNKKNVFDCLPKIFSRKNWWF